MTQLTQRSTWGRSRFGGGSAALIIGSAVVGLGLAVGAGALFAFVAYPQARILAWSVFSAGLFPVLTAACWALAVDRSTLRSAPRDPEQSIESRWYDSAAQGAFHDLLVAAGLATAIFAVLNVEAPVSLVLGAVLLLTMLSFAVRYLWLKRAEG